MLNRLQLFVLASLLSFAAMPVLSAEDVGAKVDLSLQVGNAADLVAQRLTPVSGVEVIQSSRK